MTAKVFHHFNKRRGRQGDSSVSDATARDKKLIVYFCRAALVDYDKHIFYVGDRSGDLSSNFTVPGYVRTDAALYYRHNNFQMGINFKNMFNKTYFESASPSSVSYVVPRQIELNFKWRF